MSRPMRIPDLGDVPPLMAAQRLGLSLAEFELRRPERSTQRRAESSCAKTKASSVIVPTQTIRLTGFRPTPAHMLRHACGHALGNKGHDTGRSRPGGASVDRRHRRLHGAGAEQVQALPTTLKC
jgi:hypothetical protein